jgi:hypothetical protein
MLIHENIRSLEKAKILLNRIAAEINQWILLEEAYWIGVENVLYT